MDADFAAASDLSPARAQIAHELPRLQTRARVAVALLGCQVVLSAVDAATYWFLFQRLSTSRREVGTFGALAVGFSGCFGPLLLIATIVAFCVWMHAAVSRARARVADARFSAAWSVGCWFVPIVNLWLPFIAARHLWLLSAHGVSWRGRSPSPWITAWWASLILSNVLDVSGLVCAAWPESRDSAIYLTTVGCAFDGVAALLAARFVREVTELQAERFERA